ncbi:MAG TPA: ABC transporter permease [Longimicrobiales bacterium]|nr:ABC transporter permease [Longimicrobiales bacterium]
MDRIRRDVTFALRSLARTPTFTLVAVLTLALGIGASTSIFSVVHGVMLRELPYEEPDRLVTVWLDMTERDGPLREWFTPADFEDFRAEPRLFEEIGGWGGWGPTLTGLGDPEVLVAGVVSEGMFDRVLRVQPILGRGFLPEEDVPDGANVVVLSHAFWQDRFAGDPEVLGRSVVLSEVAYTVVGVAPEGFAPPFVSSAVLWRPIRLNPASCGRGCYSVRAVARLAPGVTLDMAGERASALAARLAEAYPDTNERVGAAVFGLQEDLVGPAARALWILLGAVGLVLLIACTNVANLLLARGAAREGELAVRVAVGAGRGTILQQLLTESVVLSGLGGLFGLGLAAWGTDALLAMTPVALPGLERVGMDPEVLGFAAAATLLTGVVFGSLPAWRASRADVYATVRASTGGSGGRGRLRSGLVVGQVALAMVLLTGAGLMLKSFQRLGSVDLGFEPDGVLAVTVSLPASRFAGGGDRIAYYDELLARLAALPGVVSVGATDSPPLAGNDGDASFRIEGAPTLEPTQVPVAWVRRVTPGYLATVRQEVSQGRGFEESDAAAAPLVVVVNEMLARRYYDFPERSPLGQRIAFGTVGEPVWRTIVGVVEDTRHFGIRDGTRPAAYLPYGQVTNPFMTVVVRTAGDPEALIGATRAAVSEIDSRLAASAVAPLGDLVDQATARDRFVARLLALFSGVALLLAAGGLYGVVAYGVSLRMREMGIRLALGAGRSDVRRLVIAGGLGLSAAGIALGALAALALTRVLETLLFEVSATDPTTFVWTAAALAAAALLASWLPSHRLREAEPVAILRAE